MKANKQIVTEKKMTKVDGLIHYPDGTKVFGPDKVVVEGVNAYA